MHRPKWVNCLFVDVAHASRPVPPQILGCQTFSKWPRLPACSCCPGFWYRRFKAAPNGHFRFLRSSLQRMIRWLVVRPWMALGMYCIGSSGFGETLEAVMLPLHRNDGICVDICDVIGLQSDYGPVESLLIESLKWRRLPELLPEWNKRSIYPQWFWNHGDTAIRHLAMSWECLHMFILTQETYTCRRLTQWLLQLLQTCRGTLETLSHPKSGLVNDPLNVVLVRTQRLTLHCPWCTSERIFSWSRMARSAKSGSSDVYVKLQGAQCIIIEALLLCRLFIVSKR